MVLARLTGSFDAGPKTQAGPEHYTRSPAWLTIVNSR
jgi:hypothetical protein